MKPEARILLLAVALAVGLWYVDALVDRHAFDLDQPLPVVAANFAAHARHMFLMRTLFAASFIASGGLVAFLVRRQRLTQLRLSRSLAFQQTLVDSIPIPVFYKNADLVYTGCNTAFLRFLDRKPEQIIGKTVFELSPPELAATYDQKDRELLANPGVQIYEFRTQDRDGRQRNVVFNKATFVDEQGRVAGMIGAILDITDRIEAEQEKDQSIRQLQEALDKVRTLSGLIPICASCKKIRDDRGFWSQVENYLTTHSEAVLSHSLCPDCAAKYYPGLKLHHD